MDTTFLIGTLAPKYKIINEIDSTITVDLLYEPPFADSLIAEYKFMVDCNFLCNINLSKAVNTLFYSSCPNIQLLLASLGGQICIDAQLSCPGGNYDCGPCASAMTTYELHCDKMPSHRDSVYSYLTGDANASRKN